MKSIKIIVLGVMLGIFAFVVYAVFIPFRMMRVKSDSMLPTLNQGDYVWMKVAAKAERGDIAVFYLLIGDKELLMIKRVAGIENDYVYSDGENLYINDQYVAECSRVLDLVIPSGCYFMIGDNADDSFDSREWEDPFVKEIRGVIKERK